MSRILITRVGTGDFVVVLRRRLSKRFVPLYRIVRLHPFDTCNIIVLYSLTVKYLKIPNVQYKQNRKVRYENNNMTYNVFIVFFFFYRVCFVHT
jgi:hypothetical protein